MWIAQELAVAREGPLVMCGMKSVSWSTLIKAWGVISREFFIEIGTVRAMNNKDTRDTGDDVEVLGKLKIDILNDLREAVQRDGGQSLRQLLWLPRTSLSTDPRDRIYALLGLMHAIGDADKVTEILVDYSKPTWAVYADAMEHLFDSGQGQPATMVGVSDRVLKVEGLRIDTIHEIIAFGVSSETLANLPWLQPAANQAMKRPCQSFQQPYAALFEQFKRKEPLWRTLISNRKYMSGYDEAPRAYEDQYLQLATEDPGVGDSDTETEYQSKLIQGSGKKAFFTTCGLVGTCVPDSHAGNIVAIIFGSPVPFILRPLPAGTRHSQIYALIGASYVGGVMNGEMVMSYTVKIDSTAFFIT
ncbi:hypothetical protein BJX99DRAFT_260873 [Aspergillus californicus]